MRAATLLIIILALPFATAMTGYCTGHYVEKGPNWVDGLVQKGDVYEYYCELPSTVSGDDTFNLHLQYSNAELTQQFLAPRVVYGTTLVIFP